MKRRLRFTAAAAVLFVAGASPAHAADDWLDDMPSVARVAEIVDQAYAASAARQSTVAINTAAALMLLRQVMTYKAAEEPDMSPERRARMQAIADAYLLAELAIGSARGRRQGEPDAAALRQFYESRRHAACAPAECRQYWLRAQLEYWGAHRFREMLFPLVFPCERAPEMLEVIQRRALEMPLLPFTPALTQPQQAAETARLEALAAAPAACTADGADIDGDGRCHDWEAGLGQARAQPASAAACPIFEFYNATTEDAKSITVRYRTGPGLAGRPIRLVACRAGDLTLKQCGGPQTKPLGSATLSAPGQLAQGSHSVRVLDGIDLAPDPQYPYVVVIGDAAGHTDQAYFQKWMLGVIVHGYAFRKLLAVASTFDWSGDITRQLQLGDDEHEPWQAELLELLRSTACYHSASFAVDWRFDSTLELRSLVTARAHDLHDDIAGVAADLRRLNEGDVVDLHLIGHSRGTVFLAEALNEWKTRPKDALKGSHVRVTLLDPHPANNDIPGPQEDYSPILGRFFYDRYRAIQERIHDPLIALPGGIGIRQAEVWFQHSTLERIMAADEVRDDLLHIAPLNLWGIGGPGNHIARLADPSIRIYWRDLTNFILDEEVVDHLGVAYYFMREIRKNATPGRCVMPIH